MKKLVVIGRGTAGSQAIAHFTRWMPFSEIEWHYDPNIKPQAVGEGSQLGFPINMYQTLSFSYEDLKKLDGNFKTGVAKEGWGKSGKYFFHDFMPPSVGYHFNAVKCQDYIFEKLKNKVKLFEHNIDPENIDADYIMDCRGRPKSSNDKHKFQESKFMCVNAVHVVMCFWDQPKFDYTLAIARPYGWVFGVPLHNRCAIGYLYNKDINTIDEIKQDIINVIEKYNLTPSDTTNSILFSTYKRINNYEDDKRIVYNGNASFFFDPLEATALTVMDTITRNAYDLWHNNLELDYVRNKYHTLLDEIEIMIMMHYFSGSMYDTKFWKFAQERGTQCIEQLKSNSDFKNIYKLIKIAKDINFFYNLSVDSNYLGLSFGTWPPLSYFQNVKGLEIESKLDKIILGNN